MQAVKKGHFPYFFWSNVDLLLKREKIDSLHFVSIHSQSLEFNFVFLPDVTKIVNMYLSDTVWYNLRDKNI